MLLHGHQLDDQLRGDLLMGGSLCQELQDALFLRGERFKKRWCAGCDAKMARMR